MLFYFFWFSNSLIFLSIGAQNLSGFEPPGDQPRAPRTTPPSGRYQTPKQTGADYDSMF